MEASAAPQPLREGSRPEPFQPELGLDVGPHCPIQAQEVPARVPADRRWGQLGEEAAPLLPRPRRSHTSLRAESTTSAVPSVPPRWWQTTPTSGLCRKTPPLPCP